MKSSNTVWPPTAVTRELRDAQHGLKGLAPFLGTSLPIDSPNGIAVQSDIGAEPDKFPLVENTNRTTDFLSLSGAIID